LSPGDIPSKIFAMKYLILAILLLTLLAIPTPAYADIAPPAQPPGVNPEPGDEATQVRMENETVLLDVQAGPTSDSLGRARVTADFTMRNLGDQAESMAVRFPIGASDGWFNYPEIKDLQVFVDGKVVRPRRVQGEDPRFRDDLVPWAEFDVTFPPGEDVDIRVTYRLEGSGEYPYVSFEYILSTGAGWKDTIGSADLIVRLPYEANVHNTILDYQIGWSQTSPGAVFQGDEIRWHYDDFEPTREQDLDVALVMPSAWQKVLDEQAKVATNPRDGEAWGRLGKLYKEMTFLRKEVRGDAGGPELYELSKEAYAKSIALLPNDALWHAGFAELYLMHYYLTGWNNPEAVSDLISALDLLQRALETNPQTPKARELLENISYSDPEYVRMEGEQFIFLYLTATPLPPTELPTDTPIPPSTTPVPPTESPTDTALPSPTVTLRPTASPMASPTGSPPSIAAYPAAPLEAYPAAPQSRLEVCGVPLFAPLLILLPAGLGKWLKRKRF